MTTNVTVNVQVIVPIEHGEEAVQSFVEKLARDVVVDALHSAGKRISIHIHWKFRVVSTLVITFPWFS